MARSLAGTVWLPGGRTPGQEAVLAVSSAWPQDGLLVSRATVGPTGSVGWHLAGYFESTEIDAAGVIPAAADGVHIDVRSWNLAVNSDVVDAWGGSGTLCATSGIEPEAVLDARGVELVPIGPVRLAPSAPIDAATLSIVARAGAVEVPVRFDALENAIEVVPSSAFPPGLDVAFDAAGALDVIGRPVTIASPRVALATTAALTDLSLATEPPAGAMAGSAVTWMGGALIFGWDPWRGPGGAIVALGDVPGDTVVLHVAGACSPGAVPAAVVAASGAAAAFEVCTGDGTAADVRAPRPGPGPLWIAVSIPNRARPQWSPPPWIRAMLDEIQFE